MKYLPFLALCALMFLPTQVEAFLLRSILYSILVFFDKLPYNIRRFVTNNIIYTNQRDARDCEALFTSAGVTNTESCSCSGRSRSLTLFCDTLNEEVCLPSSDATYCTNNTYYYVYSKNSNGILYISLQR